MNKSEYGGILFEIKPVTLVILMVLLMFVCLILEASSTTYPRTCGDSPTVVFASHGDFPFGCLFTDRAFTSGFRVENATMASTISFTTHYEGQISISFEPSGNTIYSYIVSEMSDRTHSHTIEAKGETLGLDLLEIEFSGESGPGCDDNTSIEVIDAMMEVPNGDLVPMDRIDGGVFFTSSDVLQRYVIGEVYYSDGITKAFGAIIETLEINGISARDMTVFRESIGTYTQRIQDDILGASATIEIRACFPDTCGICTEPIKISYVNPGWPDDPQGEPVRHDFTLPIPPPISDPRSDIDESGKVDIDDLLILLEDWGKVSGG